MHYDTHQQRDEIRKTEAAILGSCLCGRTDEALNAGLSRDLFTALPHLVIWDAVIKTYMNRESVSLPNVGIKLSDQNLVAKLVELSEQGHTTQNMETLVSVLKNALYLRSVWTKTTKIQEMITNWRTDTPTNAIAAAILDLQEGIPSQSSRLKRTDEDAVIDWITNVEKDIEQGGISSVTTGLKELDALLNGGLKPGKLITIAARPGCGKTALATNIALSAAKAGHAIQYFSIELGKNEIIDRLISIEGEIGSTSLSRRDFTEFEMNTLATSAQVLKGLKITIECDSKGIWENVELAVKREKRQRDLKVVFIDYVQQFRLLKAAKSKREEINEITARAKAMAMELEISVVLIAQLNRDIESRTNQEPILSDLKESGSIEQDSDLVLMLYSNATEEYVGFKVAKNRQGVCDKSSFRVNFALNKFSDAV